MEEQHLPVFEEADTEKPSPKKERKKSGTGQVILVQCICCAVLILFFWLFKVFGGNAYTQLKTAFTDALQNNALLETVAQLFDDDVADESGSTATTEGTTTSVTTADGTTVTAAPATAATDG